MVYSEVIYLFGSSYIYIYCQSLILLKARIQCILVIPSEARFPLGTWLRSYVFMVYCCEFEKSRSSMLQALWLSCSTLTVALVLQSLKKKKGISPDCNALVQHTSVYWLIVRLLSEEALV